MSWMRNEAKRLSLLALFALAIQFGLSFGHIHADPAWSPAHQQTVTASSASPVGGAQADDDGLCAICITAAMVSSAAHATPPALPVPAAFFFVSFTPERVLETSPLRLAAFQSRAPPLA